MRGHLCGKLLSSGRGIEEFIREVAAALPQRALTVLLPAIVSSARATASEEVRDGVYSDSTWPFRHIGSDHDLPAVMLNTAERAARRLAAEAPEQWSVQAEFLHASIEYETPRFLLYRGWEANPDAFADQAVAVLASGRDHLRCGYADSSYWVTRQLLETSSPHCKPELFERIEQAIIGYLPDSESRTGMEQYQGQAEWVLLSSLDRRRLSQRASARLIELESRFDFDIEILSPRGIRAGFVGSPLRDNDVSGFTDEQWLVAIYRYGSDETNWVDDAPVGGADQVARQFEAAVKRDPNRFSRLGLKFSDAVNLAYFEALIRGLADSENDPSLEPVQKFLRRCHALPGRPCGRWFGSPLRKLAEAEIAADVLEMVDWYAREDPDPQRDSWLPEEGETEYWGGDILTAGINSVRGTTAETISALIFNHPDRVERFRDSLEHLAGDPVLSVRACAAQALLTLTRHDPEFATSLFLRLIDAPDILLRASTIESFLSYRGPADWDRLEDLIVRMVGSKDDEVQQAGARRAAICAFDIDGAIPIAEGAAVGTVAQRKGIAQVAAANLSNEKVRKQCEAWIAPLFSDAERDVRAEAGGWVQHVEADDLEALSEIARVFIDSPVYIEDPSMLLYRLEETTAQVPELMLYAAKQFVQGTGREAADIRRPAAADAPHASNLAMRAYSSTDEPVLRSQALDVIDQLLASGVSDMQQRMSDYDSPG